MFESLFNKVAGLETPTQVSFCEIWDIFKYNFFEEQEFIQSDKTFETSYISANI